MRPAPPSLPSVPHPIRLGVGLLVVVLTAAYVMVPNLREPLTREDGVTEWISAALFLAAGIAGVIAIRRSASTPRWSWLLPAAGFIGFGEETAYGARILGFRLPVVDGEPVDSLHDVFDIAERFITGFGIKRLHVAAVVAAAVAVLTLIAVRRGWIGTARSWFRAHQPVAYVGVAVCCSLLAVGLDLVGSSTGTRFIEEILEVTAAGTLIAGIPAITQIRHRPLDETLAPHAKAGG